MRTTPLTPQHIETYSRISISGHQKSSSLGKWGFKGNSFIQKNDQPFFYLNLIRFTYSTGFLVGGSQWYFIRDRSGFYEFREILNALRIESELDSREPNSSEVDFMEFVREAVSKVFENMGQKVGLVALQIGFNEDEYTLETNLERKMNSKKKAAVVKEISSILDANENEFVKLSEGILKGVRSDKLWCENLFKKNSEKIDLFGDFFEEESPTKRNI
jgi:hypothetical protein